MRVYAKKADREAAQEAGHELTTKAEAEALFYAELPGFDEIRALGLAGRPVVCPIAGLTGEEDFSTWADGYLAFREHHARKSISKRPVPHGRIPAVKEARIREMLQASWPKARIARVMQVDEKTVRRVLKDMNDGE